mmetsp:Transcript_3336/g.6219  ORF Transcript_3336/g.6219 Transcript_3336/m.6219 type:complete len:387 (+) Transcript_3336:53-1213(+)
MRSFITSTRSVSKLARKGNKNLSVRNLSNVEYPVLWGTSMKALVKEKAEEGLWMADVPKPAIGPNDVLIKVNKAAICGTDIHIYNWDAWASANVPTPMTIGHEYVGTIAEIGREVKGMTLGERVTGEGHITCGHCRNCKGGREHLCAYTVGVGVNRPGAFAEYISLPARNVFKLDNPIVTDDYASFMDALGNACHTALSFDLIGEDVLVTGAGPIGCMAVAVAKKVGARHVIATDVNDFRLELAEACGATKVVNVAENGHEKIKKVMADLNMKEGWDVGLEMSGNQHAFTAMVESMNTGGRISMLGIPAESFPVDWGKVVLKGLSIKGIYGREMFETWYKMHNLLASGLADDIAPIITHRMSADNFQEGFDVMRSGKSGKVILDFA